MPVDLEEQFRALLKARNVAADHCNQPLAASDVHWYGGCTEFGTDLGSVEIKCSVCEEILAEVNTWARPEDLSDALEVLEDEEWS